MRGIWSRWPFWTAYAALLWSMVYTVLGTYWALGGAGFPFGAADVNAASNGDLLAGVTAPVTGWVVAGLGLGGTVVAAAMAGRRRALRPALLCYGYAMAALLAVVLPEIRAVKYMPPLGLLAFFLPNLRPDWPTGNFVVLMVGGLVWAAATLGYQRAVAGCCANCGRGGSGRVAAWLARWGRVVTYVAVGAPWAYASMRVLWALDVPIGTEQALLDLINSGNGGGNGTRIMELSLAGMCACGSLLTVGLIRRWGEVWPRWVPGLAGGRVPPAFPIAFAGVTAFSLTATGLSWSRGFYRVVADGFVSDLDGYRIDAVYYLPGPAFLVWGVALGVAAFAYYHRRRGQCAHCRPEDGRAAAGALSTRPRPAA
ncbi:hypothetical protein ABT294_37765 [Nonomuraea sp. NPDC000554]|uniref:hypothetical protein n=1 Tax=Nonomuraea sp. NPDC000554 TaxID=3154259 RepID=UPI00332ED773